MRLHSSHDYEKPGDQAVIELATAKEVCAALKIGRTTLWRWVKEGRFPAPLAIGEHCTRWHQAEVDKWLANARLIHDAGFDGSK